MPKHLYRMAASVLKVRSRALTMSCMAAGIGWFQQSAHPSSQCCSALSLPYCCHQQTSVLVQQSITSSPRWHQLSTVLLCRAQAVHCGAVHNSPFGASSARLTLCFACLQHFSRPGILEQIVPYLPSRRQQQMEAARTVGVPQAVADAQAACKQHNCSAQATELSKVSKHLEPTLPQVRDRAGVSNSVDSSAAVEVLPTSATLLASMGHTCGSAESLLVAGGPCWTTLPPGALGVCCTATPALHYGMQHPSLQHLKMFTHLPQCVLIIAAAVHSALLMS